MVRTSPVEVKSRYERCSNEVSGGPRAAALARPSAALALAPAALPLAAAALALARDLPAGAARLAQTDRDGLLAAGDLLAGSPRAQRPVLALVRRTLDLALRFPAVFRHKAS